MPGRRPGRRIEDDPDRQAQKLLADAWCAALIQRKLGLHTTGPGITHAVLKAVDENPESVPDRVVAVIKDTAGDVTPAAVDARALYLTVRQTLTTSDFNKVSLMVPAGPA